MELGAIIEAISNLSGEELKRVREAVEERRERLYIAASLSSEAIGSGILQLEYRKNPKTGTRRGPYWYFHYWEGGQTAHPFGRSDDPEEVLAEKLFD